MKYRSGFTLIELMVVVALVAILGAVLFDRVQAYQEQAEKAAVEQTLAAIRSGLQLQFAGRMLRGEGARLGSFADENPMDVLAEPVQNFGGIFSGAAGAGLKKGTWYFNQERRELLYLPNLNDHLQLGPNENALRFQVLLLGAPPAGPQATPSYTGIRLVPVMRYQWF